MDKNVGKWNIWYKNLAQIEAYGDTITYTIGADFLSTCETVEDWGCGKGWFRKFRETGYIGLDGSQTPYADKVIDLTEYRSTVDGIFMRHVLEHNYEWKAVLENALESFREKMVLIIFTPFSDETKEIAFFPEIGVPDISFSKEELQNIIKDHKCNYTLREGLETDTAYGVEHIFLIEK